MRRFSSIFRPRKTKPIFGGKLNESGVPSQSDTLSSDLARNLEVLQTIYTDCADVIFRRFQIAGSREAFLLYIEGLVNTEEIDDSVLTPLMRANPDKLTEPRKLVGNTISVSSVQPVTTFTEIIGKISSGNPVLLIDEVPEGISLGLTKYEKRAVEEPTAESVIKGPREGFTESLIVNLSLLRRRIKSPAMKIKNFTLGSYSQTKVALLYIEGLADKTLIEEASNRINRIQIDGILENSYIEEFIEDHPYSPFPQLLNTERPDVAAANLLEGRVAILTDGTPFALIAPTTLYAMLQSAEDYYQRFWVATAIRWLRFVFFLLSLLLPSAYVAILTFHQEMVPTTLLLSVAKSREEIPFPALIEALIMEVSFEALREAGVRLPKQVGAAVSIVGALVIGQAATSAGLVSSPMVMVVALTGIASFTIPRYPAGAAIRLLRFPIMLMAGTLGLLGIMLSLITIIIHLCSLRSFGVPYLSPLGPIKAQELKDVLIRAPWWSLSKRPHLTGNYRPTRIPQGQKPGPDKGKE